MCDYSQLVQQKFDYHMTWKNVYVDINTQLQHKDNKMIGHTWFADRNK
jgi:hypothetical protein